MTKRTLWALPQLNARDSLSRFFHRRLVNAACASLLLFGVVSSEFAPGGLSLKTFSTDAQAAPCVITTPLQFHSALSQGLIAIQNFDNGTVNIWAAHCSIPVSIRTVEFKVLYPQGDPRELTTQEQIYDSGPQGGMNVGDLRNFGVASSCRTQTDGFLGGLDASDAFFGFITRNVPLCPPAAPAATDNAQCVNIDSPATVAPGAQTHFRVTVTNNGSTTWTPGGPTPYRLMKPDDVFGPGRIDLPQTVPPGTSVDFNATFAAPTNPGTYTIDYVMGRETVANFGTHCVKQIQVSAPQPTTTDLTITKNGPQSVTRPGTASYAITVHNNGPVDAQNVVVTDQTPDAFQFNTSDAGCSTQGNNVVCNIGTLTNGATKTINISFTVPSQGNSCVAGPVTNTATVSTTTTDQNQGNNTSSFTTQVNCPTPTTADLAISKSAPATFDFTRPSTATYGIHVHNNGPAAAQNVIVTDVVPDTLTFSGSNAGCVLLQGNTVSCNIGTLNNGETRDIDITFSIPPIDQCSARDITNSATVTSDTADSNRSNNFSNTVTIRVNCPQPTTADLSIVKTEDRNSVGRGENITYTLVAHNGGPAATQHTVIEDRVPVLADGQLLQFLPSPSSSNCVLDSGAVNGPTVHCDNFDLNANDSRTFTIVFGVPPPRFGNACDPETFRNTATISSPSTTDPNPSNNQSTVTAQTVCTQQTNADVTITKSAFQSSVQPGDILTYKLVVTNVGSATAQNVSIIDPIPSGLTFLPFQWNSNGIYTPLSFPSDMSCRQNGGVIICDGLVLPAGQSRTVWLSFKVSQSIACNSTIINQATVTASNDTNPGNNQSNVVQTQVNCPQQNNADLSIQKSGPASVVQGGTIIYTLTVTNNGPAASGPATVTDQIPAGLTFLHASSDGACSQQGLSIVCAVPSLGVNQSKPFQVAFSVTSATVCNSNIVNSAYVSSANDSNTSNNTSNPVYTSVNCGSSSSSSSTPLGCINIVKQALNAQNVVINPPIQQFTFKLDGNAQQTTSDSNGNASFQNVTPGSHTVSEILSSDWTQQAIYPANGVVFVNPGSSCAMVIVQNKQVSGGTPTFAITKTDNRTYAAPGDVLTYVITVTNTSQVNAPSVTVTDSLPTSLVTFSSASDNGTFNGQTVSWSGISLAPGASRTFTIQATVNSYDTNGTVITNTAQVNGVTATDTTTVQTNNNGTPTFAISKTDNRTTIAPGDSDTYVITVTNTSQVNAPNVTVTDTFPTSQLSFVSASDGGYFNGQTVTWSGISLAPGASRTFTIQATVSYCNCGGSVITNTAQVNGITATDTTTLQSYNITNNQCPLIDITDDRDPVNAGDVLTYTIRLNNYNSIYNFNNNFSSNLSTQLRATLDSDTSFLDASNGGYSVSRSEVDWNNVSLNSYNNYNGNSTLTLRVRVLPDARNPIILHVTSNNCASTSETTQVLNGNVPYPPYSPYPPPLVSYNNGTVTITKQADRYEAGPNDDVTYTVTITNAMSIPAANFQVVDSYSGNAMTVFDAGGGQPGVGQILWNIPTLDVGQSRSFVYHGHISGGVQQGDTLHNTATVQGGNIPVPSSASADVRIITRLPQTGNAGYTNVLQNTQRFLSPVGSSDAGSMPGIVWSSILLFALSVGGTVLKKQFFI